MTQPMPPYWVVTHNGDVIAKSTSFATSAEEFKHQCESWDLTQNQFGIEQVNDEVAELG